MTLKGAASLFWLLLDPSFLLLNDGRLACLCRLALIRYTDQSSLATLGGNFTEKNTCWQSQRRRVLHWGPGDGTITVEVDFSTTGGVHHQAGLEPRQLSGPRDGGWETRDGARSGARLEPDNCLSPSSPPSLFVMTIMIMIMRLDDDDDYNWIPEPAHCVPLLFYPLWPGPSVWLIMIMTMMMIFWWIMMMMIMTGSQTLPIAPPLLSPPESLLVVHFLEGESSYKAKQKLSNSGPKDKISKNCIAPSSSVTHIKVYFELGESWSTRRGVVVTLGGYKTILDHYYEHMVSSRGLIAFCSCLWPPA